jgi:hypothetical protein
VVLTERCAADVGVEVNPQVRYRPRCRLSPGHDGPHEGNPWPFFGGLLIWHEQTGIAAVVPWTPVSR